MLVAIVIGAFVCGAQASEQKALVQSDKQLKLHEMAETARSMGITEDDILIKRLQELWWEEYYRIEAESQIPEIDEWELEMLACVIFQEAGGDECTDLCRYYVGDVVLNRIMDDRFPDNMYEVLTQKYQYGRFYWTGIVWPSRASNPNEAYTSWQIKDKVLYETAPVMNDDKFEVSVTDGSISVKNISGVDITSDVFIYYKNKQDNMLNGNVTHRIRVSGLKADSQTYVKADGLNESNCQIIFTEYDDKKV